MKLIITIMLATLLLTLPLRSISQDKQPSKPRNGIEANLQAGQLMEDIPIDQDVTLFGALPDSTVLSGTVEIWRRVNDVKYDSITAGDLKILDKKNFQCYVNHFFTAGKTYKMVFRYEKQMPSKFLSFIKLRLTDYYREIFEFAGSINGEMQKLRIEMARQKLVDDVLAKAKSFDLEQKDIRVANGLLDNDVKRMAFQLVDVQVMAPIVGFTQKMNEIEKHSKNSVVLLRIFASAHNMDVIGTKLSTKLLNNLKQLNEDDEFAMQVGSGLVFLSDTVRTPLPTLANTTASQLKQIVENIHANVSIIKKMEMDDDLTASWHILADLRNELLKVDEQYQSIWRELASLENTLQMAIGANVVREVQRIYSVHETVTADFEASAKWYISADIGVSFLNLAKNTDVNPNATNDSWKLLPYFGINISPLPTNKKNNLKRLLKHYKWPVALLKLSSIGLGVTMSSLDTDKYKGIFNIDSPRGVLTGFGIRPIPQIKLSIGGFWYNRKNGNTLTNSYNIAVKTFFSISLDWDLRTLIPSIKSLFN